MNPVIEQGTRTPRTSSRKVKKHSLKPQIFLQLELSSPQGKSIDPSMIGVLHDGWQGSSSVNFGNGNQFMTHVRVEHCEETLASEPAIRDKGDQFYLPSVPNFEEDAAIDPAEETSSAEFQAAEISTGSPNLQSEPVLLSPSPTSVMSTKFLGRHDHLLEPLPNELFQPEKLPPVPRASTHKSTTDNTTKESSVRSFGSEEVVDVTQSNLDIFDLVIKNPDEEVKPHNSRKKVRKGLLRRTRSVGEIDASSKKNSASRKSEKESSLGTPTNKRGRRKSVGADRVRGRSGRQSTLDPIDREWKSKSKPSRLHSVSLMPRPRRRSSVNQSFSNSSRLSELTKSSEESSDAPSSTPTSSTLRKSRNSARISISSSRHSSSRSSASSRSPSRRRRSSVDSRIAEDDKSIQNLLSAMESIGKNPRTGRRKIVATVNFAGVIVSPVASPGSLWSRRSSVSLSQEINELAPVLLLVDTSQ